MSDQPAQISLESYDDINQIRRKFEPLTKINLNHKFNNLEESKFFIIRNQGEDSVYRLAFGQWMLWENGCNGRMGVFGILKEDDLRKISW